MLPQWAFDCPAFRTLKPGPRALLWELIRRFNGGNNGRIAFCQRDMAKALNIADRGTVAGYVRELVARGFIKATRLGAFSVKLADRRATEWALTWHPVGDELATKEFMRWRPDEKNDGTEKPANRGGNAAPLGPAGVRPRSDVPEKPSRLPPLRVVRGTG